MATRKSPHLSGKHANPRMLITATPEELAAWKLAAELAGSPNRVDWLKTLANQAARRILKKSA